MGPTNYLKFGCAIYSDNQGTCTRRSRKTPINFATPPKPINYYLNLNPNLSDMTTSVATADGITNAMSQDNNKRAEPDFLNLKTNEVLSQLFSNSNIGYCSA